MKVLMVCLGNICRSPMAEGILRKKIQVNNLDVVTDSCGTGNWHVGQKPDDRAIKTMKSKGIDITDLRARQFSESDFNQFDMIYCMDETNYNDILALAKTHEQKSRVKMILNEINPKANQSVPDPYFGGDDGFENVYQLLDIATDKFLEKYV